MDGRWRRAGRGAAALLAAAAPLAGCRCGSEPSCIPCYQRCATAPLDATGAYPPALLTPASFSELGSARGDSSPQAGMAGATPRDGELAAPAATQLQVPPELPGAEAGPIAVPPIDGAADGARQAALEQMYFPLPSVEGSPPAPPPAGGAIDLAGLQAIALANNPTIRAAAAAVESARGQALQAGLCPNPEVGYEADTINTLNTPGYHGGYVQQTIVTGGKLRLAQAAAEVEVLNAQVSLRRARIDVATAVRTAYFQALVARERLRIQRALAHFTEQVFRTQVRLVEAGEAAAYEPLQLRVYVVQSRAAVVEAEQRYAAARRQLAAALGMPQTPLGELAGRADMPIPAIDYDTALGAMLANHTDLTIARNRVVRMQRLVELARVTPLPNIDAYVAVMRDYTFEPGATAVNVQVGGPFPVFNRNTGNIISAEANLVQAQQSIAQAEIDLTARLADAYGRYESNRRFVQDFQGESLRDQVRTYRGIYQRYRNDAEELKFGEVFVAQQTLATLLNQYVDLLGEQWQAVVDVAELLQVDDIYLLGEVVPLAPLPELLEPGETLEQPATVGVAGSAPQP